MEPQPQNTAPAEAGATGVADEAALVARARAGEVAAFGELHRRHHEQVYRTVLGIVRHEEDARDVCQEVWVKAWRELPGFRGGSRLTTWLHPIAVRRSIDFLRRRRRWWARFVPWTEGVPDRADEGMTGDPRGMAERGESDDRFARALELLSPSHRAVLALREVEGLSYDEIAAAVGCRRGTVMSRLFHARRQLAAHLVAAGGTAPAVNPTAPVRRPIP